MSSGKSDQYNWLGMAREITSSELMPGSFDEDMEALIYRKKRTIKHRPFRLPSTELSSPKQTATKMSAEAVCRMCLRTARVRPLTRHHLVPESWFRQQPLALKMIRNAHANIVPLCRSCHDRVDNYATEEELRDRVEARRHLRRSLTQQEIAFAIQVRGQDWLDHHYPLH